MKRFVLMLMVAGLVFPATILAKVPPKWKNCAVVNKRFLHGVGKAKAHDKTNGIPVVTFNRSTKLYRIAIKANKRLDGDKDGIACEKK